MRHLAQQVFPENPKFLQESFNDATAEAHGYLMLDLKQFTSDEYRVKTKVFPDDSFTVVYVPKQK